MIIDSVVVESNWQGIESVGHIINSFCGTKVTIKGSSWLIKNIDQLSVHTGQIIGLYSWASVVLIDNSSSISAIVFWVVKASHFPKAILVFIKQQFSCSQISKPVCSSVCIGCWLSLFIVIVGACRDTNLTHAFWIVSNNKIMKHRANGFIGKKDIVILYLYIASLELKYFINVIDVWFAAAIDTSSCSALRDWSPCWVVIIQTKNLTYKSYALFIDSSWLRIWCVEWYRCTSSEIYIK